MSRINEEFINEYMKLERLCCGLFDIESHGVEAYISNMEKYLLDVHQNCIYDENELLYLKTVSSKFAVVEFNDEYEADITPADIEWLRDFRYKILDEKDPITFFEHHLKEQRKTKRQIEKESFMEFQMEHQEKEQVSDRAYKNFETEPKISRIDAFKSKSSKEKTELLVAGVVVAFIVIGMLVYLFMK